MNEVEKMRSSQLADMSAPEVQVKFEYAKKLLARMRQLSTYDEAYRGLLEYRRHPLCARLSIAIMGMVYVWVNTYL